MSDQLIPVNEKLKAQIINVFESIAGSRQITAACIVGDYAMGLANTSEVLETLLVIRDFQPRLTSYVKVAGGRNIIVFGVDEWIFERDVDKGFLGEALVERVIFPYIPLVNIDYLHVQEVRLKKRLILELLENLVLDFPELSYNLQIKPEYFMYETIMSRARLFPPMVYTVSNFLHEDAKNKNVESVMYGYLEALEELEKENIISFSRGYVKISQELVQEVRSKRIRFVNLFKTARKALFTSFLGTFSKTLDFLARNKSGFIRFQKSIVEDSGFLHQLEDPLGYLCVPTASGLVPLSTEMDIEAFAREIISKDEEVQIEIEKIGGALNDVYLIKTSTDNEKGKTVVKRFKDWSSIKWFPLNLWTLGTKTFAVLARSRLENECSISQFLNSNGFEVPEILYVSHIERLVFKEYVEGEKLNKIITNILKAKNHKDLEDFLIEICKVGETFAEVHALGIALGDTKPENIMIRRKDGAVCLLDLEQASRKGDKTWDIAEFLYYSGHYIPPWAGTSVAGLMTNAFIDGYLQAGGDANLVKKAASPKYTKVFSVFTFPHVILAISNICRKRGKSKK